MLQAKRLMVLAPHADDESLGCGGLLLASPSAEKRLVLVSCSDVTVHHGKGSPVLSTAADRRSEFRTAAEFLGAEASVLGFPTRGLSSLNPELVAAVEAEVDRFRPDCLLLPGRSFHEDHVAVYRAAHAALRPNHCRTVRTVLAYETPFYAWAAEEDRFVPNLYARLTETQAQSKLLLCAVYRSQRLHDEQSQGAVRRHMLRRGMEAEPVPRPEGGLPYAEAFRLVRGVL